MSSESSSTRVKKTYVKPIDGYQSIQSQVNCLDGLIDPEKLEKQIESFMSEKINVWEELEPSCIDKEDDKYAFDFVECKIKSGDRIRYVCYGLDFDDNIVTEEKMYRTGGWVIKVSDRKSVV